MKSQPNIVRLQTQTEIPATDDDPPVPCRSIRLRSHDDRVRLKYKGQMLFFFLGTAL